MKHDNPQELMMRVLRRALSLKRPTGSFEEGSLLLSLAFDVRSYRPNTTMFVDTAGNLHVDMRAFNKRSNTKNRTLFVAHVDTVHRAGGPNVFDDSTTMWKAAGGQPLGADDGAGVAVLSALIRSGKAAYYIFTRGEEAGGIGSKHLAAEMPELLYEFDRAIAFDRKDVFSVITHQGWGGRCCSNKFAEALCTSMNDLGMMMMPDDGGVYTDTAEFVEIIPECTNISAGYYREHSKDEHLDTEYLQQLTAAATTLDWDALPTERDPDVYEALERESWYPPATPTVGYKAAAEQLSAVKDIFERARNNPTPHPRGQAGASASMRMSASDETASNRAEKQAELDAAWEWFAPAARDADERDAEFAARRDAKTPRLLQADRDATQDALNSMSDDDPAFSWSDDGKNFYTGSGRKDN